MVSSVGLDARSSCAAVRARIARVEETPFYDELGQPVLGAVAAEALEYRNGWKSLVPLASRAIYECTSAADINKSRRTALLIVIDELDRPDFPADLASVLFQEIRNSLDLDFRISKESELSATGITGFFRAVQRARELLTDRVVDACVVVAVDSLLNSMALQWLRDQGRLKSALNSDGVIPGEGAAAVCLMRCEDSQNSDAGQSWVSDSVLKSRQEKKGNQT